MKTFTNDGVPNMKNLNARTRRLVALLAVVAVGSVSSFSGCATPEEINRVQPDLIKKSDLAGEWYYLDSIVRAPYADRNMFTGLQGTLERGAWQVEEKFLYFYRTYEFVEGVEQQGIRSDVDSPMLDASGNPITYVKTLATPAQGVEDIDPDVPGTQVHAVRYVYRSSPLMRYDIEGHYDIRKKYNGATGEQSNVTVEDSSELYWFDREYIRVKFNTSLETGPGAVSGLYEGENGPEQLAFRMGSDGRYMDYVIRNIMPAPQVWYGSWGWIPQCLFYPWYLGGYAECLSEEVHVRHSFMRVPEDNTYRPMHYNDHMLGKFGYYRSSRADWDQFYGKTYTAAHRNIRRFRIWEEYVVDANGDLDYANMTPKPVIYYLSPEFPRNLIGGALDLADQWNALFAETVRELKAGVGQEWNGRSFVLCENNLAEVSAIRAADPDAVLAETDPVHCKDMQDPKYYGDLRYNMLASINDPTQYGLYGYGPMHSDPITGETIHANAFNYTQNMRMGARTAVDMIEYAAGVQDFVDVTQAQHITTAIDAKALKNTERNPRSSMTMEEAQQVASTVVPTETHAHLKTVGLQSSDFDRARVGLAKLKQLGPDFDFIWKNADMATLTGLPVDDLENVKDPNGFLESQVHPAELGSEAQLLRGFRERMARGHQAICMGDQFDDSFRGLAMEYKSRYDKAVCEALSGQDNMVFDYSDFDEPGASCDADASGCTEDQICTFLEQGEASGKYCITPCSTKLLLDQLRSEIRRVNQISEFVYWDPSALYSDVKDERVVASQEAAKAIIAEIREEVFSEVFDRIWSTVAMHEVGHNVGLRHNFASSTDALNYFPGYWDLKGFEAPDGTWYPKNLWQRDTGDQTAQRMREYQQTSIMEYTGAFNARYQGLGSYDRAAILFGYGELVNVFTTPPDMAALDSYLEEPGDTEPTNYAVSEGWEAPLAKALRKLHHTNYPAIFGSVDNIVDRGLAHWSELLLEDADGNPVSCSSFDHPYDDAVCGTPGSYCQPFPTGHFCTRTDLIEVPLRFCSDEYNWTSPTCHTWDEGSDSFEIVVNSIDDYESYWPFRAYKRDSDTWSPNRSYWSRIQFDMFFWRKHFEHWAYNFARYNKDDWWEDRYGTPWHMDMNGGLGDTIASKMIFEQMANVFGRPSDGYYGWNVQAERYEPVVNNGKNSYSNIFQIREDEGARPMYPSYDFSGYLYTPRRAGTFYDRLSALMVMTYPQMLFVNAVDTNYDMRRFRLSFGDVWPQRMQNLLSGLVTSDPVSFGWCIEHDGVPPTEGGNGDPIGVKPKMWFGTTAELDAYYDNCVPLTPEPEYTFPTTQYRLPALAILYGMVFMEGTFDRSFTDRIRIWLDGEGDDITIPDGFAIVTYTDPFSGKIYEASYDPSEFDPTNLPSAREMIPDVEFFDHQRHIYWPAAQLVAQAAALKAEYAGNLPALSDDYAFSTLQHLVGRLEIIRGIYRSLEFGW